MEKMAYDPVTGENWSQREAAGRWAESMRRASPAWSLRVLGMAEATGLNRQIWGYFNFGPHTGQVTIGPDGFRWRTVSYDTGDLIHQGVTTSLYAAYQSVVQNRPVSPPPAYQPEMRRG